MDLGAPSRTYRPRTPPVPVNVDLAIAFPPINGITWGTKTPIIARAEGLPQQGIVPGLLLAWVEDQTGGWWGHIRLTLISANRRLRLTVEQLLPSAAITLQ